MTLGCDVIVFVENIRDKGGLIVHALWLVVDEVLGCFLHSNILRIAVHRADKAMDDILLIAGEVAEGYIGNLRKASGGIVGSQRSPVVVGTQIDVLTSVLAQCGIYVYSLDILIKMGIDVVDGRQLWLGAFLHLVGTIEVDGYWYNHTIDVHLVFECLLIQVDDVSKLHSAASLATISHHSPDLLARTHYDDSCMGYLGILVGCQFVLIFLCCSVGCAFACLFLRLALGFQFFWCRSLGSMECDVVFVGDESLVVFDAHTQRHQ